MKKKIIGILISTLFIAAILLPTVSSMIAVNKHSFENPNLETVQLKGGFSGVGTNLDNWAITDSFSLTGIVSPILRIHTLYDILPMESGDYGHIKISNNGGSDWTILTSIEGYTSDWIFMDVSLANWTGNVLIGFEYKTESDSISDGWFIYEIIVRGSHEDVYYEDFSEYDIGDSWGDWIIAYQTEVPNASPDTPIIGGENTGKPGEEYTYTFISGDLDGDDVFYYIDWGDDTTPVVWDGPHPPSTQISLKHTYEKRGTYTIGAKAKDTNEEESKVATFIVKLSRNKNIQVINSLFLDLIEKLLEPIIKLLSNYNRII